MNKDALLANILESARLRANGRNNANNVGSCCVRFGSGVQTNATTPNNVGTCSASWEGYSLCKPCAMSLRGPNNVGRAVQTDPSLCATLRWSRSKRNVGSCWLKSLTGFKLCATCNIQQCWELLANNVASFCTGLKIQRREGNENV